MPWVRIDDRFDEHPKLAEAGAVCWGIWLAGITYCNRNLTDGFIPWTAARSLGSWKVLSPPDPDADDRRQIWTIARTSGAVGEDMDTEWIIERLLAAGLWDVEDGGYRIHDYADYQRSRTEVLGDRDKVKGRVADWRKRNAGGNADGNAVTNEVGNGVGNEEVTPSSRAGKNPNPKPTTRLPVSNLPTTNLPTSDSSTQSRTTRARNDDFADAFERGFDLSDPIDVWTYLFSKPPTERQRDTFLASWIGTEGKPGTIVLLRRAAQARAGGERGAADFVAWINAIVEERKQERLTKAGEDLSRRHALANGKSAAEADAAEATLRASVKLWAARGKIEAEAVQSTSEPAAYLKQYAEAAKHETKH